MIAELLTSVGVAPKTALQFAPVYQAQFAVFGIDSNLVICHFFAQVLHESGKLRYMSELWGPTSQQKKYERDFNKPWDKKQLAFRLGNVHAGDGRRFMGRGGIQRTGRANYAEFQKQTGIRVLEFPSLLSQPQNAVVSDLMFFTSRGLHAIAAGDDAGVTEYKGKEYNTALYYITKKVNGGFNGLDERQLLFKQLMRASTKLLDQRPL